MTRLSRTLLVVFGLLLLIAPVASFGEEVPVEVEKKLAAGTSYVDYGDQNFRIVSTLPVTVTFETLTSFTIHLKLVGESDAGKITIFWLNFERIVYQGPIPAPVPWEGNLNTEGGFVDR